MEACVNCGNIKTGTVKKRRIGRRPQNMVGTVHPTNHLPPRENALCLSLSCTCIHTAICMQALSSSRMTRVPGQNTKARGGSATALNAEKDFLPLCLPTNVQNPSLFLRWHVGPSIQLRQANHCAEEENLSQGRTTTSGKVSQLVLCQRAGKHTTVE